MRSERWADLIVIEDLYDDLYREATPEMRAAIADRLQPYDLVYNYAGYRIYRLKTVTSVPVGH